MATRLIAPRTVVALAGAAALRLARAAAVALHFAATGAVLLVAALRHVDAAGLDLLGSGNEALGQRHDGELLADQPLDVAQIRPLVIGAEADRHAVIARARGAADAVDILVRHVRQLEVEDMADARHVDAARRDVGRDEDLHLARAELAERALALRLALVAVDRVGGDAVAREQADDAVGAVLGAGEHQRAIDLDLLEHHRQQRLLLGLLDESDALLDALGRGRLGGDLHFHRLLDELAGELADRLGHGRREEQRLALGRQLSDDALEGVDEAQVHHLVGLVEHEDLEAHQDRVALVHQVDEAARRGDEDVDALGEIGLVLVDRRAAEDGGDGEAGALGIVARLVGDLAGQFARRGEHQHAAAARLGALARCDQPVDRGEHEGGGLSGAGLGDAEQVASFEERRDCLGLDRRRLAIALGGKRGENGLRETELIELHYKSCAYGRRTPDGAQVRRRGQK